MKIGKRGEEVLRTGAQYTSFSLVFRSSTINYKRTHSYLISITSLMSKDFAYNSYYHVIVACSTVTEPWSRLALMKPMLACSSNFFLLNIDVIFIELRYIKFGVNIVKALRQPQALLRPTKQQSKDE